MPIARRPNNKFFELLAYQPFEIQEQIHKSRADRRVVCVGRQVGKSEAASIESVFELFTNPGSVGWVVAPTYEQAEFVFNRTVEKAEKLVEHFPHVQVIAQRRRLRLKVVHYDRAPAKPGHFYGMQPVAVSEFRGKSSDRPGNLKGATLNFVIFDEAALIPQGVWTEAIEPMLSTTAGWALFISTPRGYNWFYRYFARGWKGKTIAPDVVEQFGILGITTPPPTPTSELDVNFESFHASSWEVRHVDVGVDWYLRSKASSLDLEFRQEYGAEFISHSGSVFRGMDQIKRVPFKWDKLKRVVLTPQEGHDYVIGADFGKNMDFSVFSAVDLESGICVAMLRTNETAWRSQVEILSKLAAEYNQAVVVADTWGVGQVLIEDLQALGLAVIEAPFKTLQIKEEYIRHFGLLMEQGRIVLPDDELIFDELRMFQYYATASGKTTMRAYGRGHDDIVVSLALAYSMIDGEGLFEFPDVDARDEELAIVDIYAGLEDIQLDHELAEATRMFKA